MALALLLIGIMLASVGIQGTQAQLASLLVTDFTGAGSFWYFVGGIFIVGSLGYYSPLRGASQLTILLIILVFLLSNQGFYAQLVAALQSPKPGPKAAPVPAPTADNPTDIVGQVGAFLGAPSFLTSPNNPLSSLNSALTNSTATPANNQSLTTPGLGN